LVVIGCTSRQSWTFALVGVGVGVGVGVADPEPEVGDGVGVGSELLLGLAEAERVGVAAADVVLDALADALAVALALALLAEALAVISGVDLALALGVGVGVALGVLAAWNAASRVTLVRPAGIMRAALAAAGGEPHALGAAAVTAASAGLAAPSRPPTMPEDTTAALATAPSAVVADRADFMAVLS
jgi:hypothetical protein